VGGKKTKPPLHCAPPDFLLNWVGSASFMRLSEKKQVLDYAAVGVWHGGKHHEKAGAPSFASFAKGGIRDSRYRDSWYPTLRKKREGPRISYCAAPAMAACAAFYKESRMRFVDPKLHRKSEGMGHPGICCAAGDKKCPVSYPAGRLRRWTTLRKAAHAALSTAAQQEIRVRFGRDDKSDLGYGPCGLSRQQSGSSWPCGSHPSQEREGWGTRHQVATTKVPGRAPAFSARSR
jgi:hypothetical protein